MALLLLDCGSSHAPCMCCILECSFLAHRKVADQGIGQAESILARLSKLFHLLLLREECIQTFYLLFLSLQWCSPGKYLPLNISKYIDSLSLTLAQGYSLSPCGCGSPVAFNNAISSALQLPTRDHAALTFCVP